LAFAATALLLSAFACDEASPERRQPAGATSDRPAVTAPAGALRDGDIVFHESMSRQSEMVRALTGSRWTHMGVVFVEPSGPMVFEAVSPVGYTTLAKWTARGRNERYVVKRLRDAETRLSPDVLRKMRGIGRGWVGRPYDLRFRWGDEAMYCSELVYKLFERGAGVRIGKVQRASEMNLDDERVKAARDARFGPGQFDPDESIVTPVSMFEDDALVTVREE